MKLLLPLLLGLTHGKFVIPNMEFREQEAAPTSDLEKIALGKVIFDDDPSITRHGFKHFTQLFFLSSLMWHNGQKTLAQSHFKILELKSSS